MLPFSQDELFAVFAAYNRAVWPAQVVLSGLLGLLLFRSAARRPRTVATASTMSRRNHSRPVGLVVLLAALLVQGLSGLVGGIGLVTDPTGGSLDLPLRLLEGSPFDDYFVPGLLLLTLLGVLPLVALYGLWKRLRWSWPLALMVGPALLVWIAVQIAWIGYQPRPPLQLLYGALGLVLSVSALLPSVRREWSSRTESRVRA